MADFKLLDQRLKVSVQRKCNFDVGMCKNLQSIDPSFHLLSHYSLLPSLPVTPYLFPPSVQGRNQDFLGGGLEFLRRADVSRAVGRKLEVGVLKFPVLEPPIPPLLSPSPSPSFPSPPSPPLSSTRPSPSLPFPFPSLPRPFPLCMGVWGPRPRKFFGLTYGQGMEKVQEML
jgi:hypothetical protein